MNNSGRRKKALAENRHPVTDLRKQTEALRAAETRTLEMIADGARLSDVLNALCAAVDDHAAATTFVCLMDSEGNQLLPVAGPRLQPSFATAITPWPIGPKQGLLRHSGAYENPRDNSRHF